MDVTDPLIHYNGGLQSLPIWNWRAELVDDHQRYQRRFWNDSNHRSSYRYDECFEPCLRYFDFTRNYHSCLHDEWGIWEWNSTIG